MTKRTPLCLLLVALLAAACDDPGAPTPPPVDTAPSASAAASAAEPTAAAPSASASAAPEEAKGPEYESLDLPDADLVATTLEEQRAAMLRRMRTMLRLDDAQVEKLRAIIEASKRLGQGNPAVVEHPMTRSECLERRKEARDEVKPVCGAPYMVPLYDPEHETEAQAKVCIDRYEFPGLPCDYPVTWVSTAEAQQLCQAIGKRLCDAHEWEGACAGKLRSPEVEYSFVHDRKTSRGRHNHKREIVWAYGTEKDHSKCATSSKRSKTCQASGWKKCGSNTYPAGAFPECKSSFGVYDLHGNAAEHMALPLKEKDLGSRGGFGQPEMKGSWFIFNTYEAHIDDCRWRAPAWHDNEGKNHRNYHLGFRCCKDIAGSD